MNTKCRILIVTEANETVASGHLLESIELTDLLRANGYHTDLCINDDCFSSLKSRISGDYCEYHRSVTVDHIFFDNLFNIYDYQIIITDLRDVQNDWIQKIRGSSDSIIICIDEWGHKKLDCDVIINPMIDPYFWTYTSKALIFSGHEYLILPQKILLYHKIKKEIGETIDNVCISMGGVDKKGNTLKIVKWLIGYHPEVSINIIIGGGFIFRNELDEIIHGYNNIRVMQNVENIYDYFIKADVAFAAGGNTLHELACIGTPTIVIPTMEHELKNGMFFEKNEFGITLDMMNHFSISQLNNAWDRISARTKRLKMSISGKRICSGNGAKTVLAIVKSTRLNYLV